METCLVPSPSSSPPLLWPFRGNSGGAIEVIAVSLLPEDIELSFPVTETTVSMVSNGTLVAPCIALDTSVVMARLLPFAG